MTLLFLLFLILLCFAFLSICICRLWSALHFGIGLQCQTNEHNKHSTPLQRRNRMCVKHDADANGEKFPDDNEKQQNKQDYISLMSTLSHRVRQIVVLIIAPKSFIVMKMNICPTDPIKENVRMCGKISGDSLKKTSALAKSEVSPFTT